MNAGFLHPHAGGRIQIATPGFAASGNHWGNGHRVGISKGSESTQPAVDFEIPLKIQFPISKRPISVEPAFGSYESGDTRQPTSHPSGAV